MPKSKESTDQRDQILDAATAEFADHGFSGARMDRIADRAEVNKASIYYHLGNKEELYEEVFVRLLESVGQRFETLSERIDGGSDSIKENLKMMLTEVGEHLVKNDHYRILLSDIIIGDRDIPELAMAQAIENAEVFRSVFNKGVEEGVFRDVSPLAAYLTFFSSILFFAAMRSKVRDVSSLIGDPLGEKLASQQVPDELLELVFQGLLAEGDKDA